jgi:hypothetical protein
MRRRLICQNQAPDFGVMVILAVVDRVELFGDEPRNTSSMPVDAWCHASMPPSKSVHGRSQSILSSPKKTSNKDTCSLHDLIDELGCNIPGEE